MPYNLWIQILGYHDHSLLVEIESSGLLVPLPSARLRIEVKRQSWISAMTTTTTLSNCLMIESRPVCASPTRRLPSWFAMRISSPISHLPRWDHRNRRYRDISSASQADLKDLRANLKVCSHFFSSATFTDKTAEAKVPYRATFLPKREVQKRYQQELAHLKMAHKAFSAGYVPSSPLNIG